MLTSAVQLKHICVIMFPHCGEANSIVLQFSGKVIHW